MKTLMTTENAKLVAAVGYSVCLIGLLTLSIAAAMGGALPGAFLGLGLATFGCAAAYAVAREEEQA